MDARQSKPSSRMRPRAVAGGVVGAGLGTVFGVTIGDVGAGLWLGGIIGAGSVLLWEAFEDD